MARPKKFNNPRKVSIVMEKEEFDMISEKAGETPLSEWIRQKILRQPRRFFVF